MATKTYPVFGGGAVATSQLTFPLIAPTPGAAGSEPFRFQTGGGVHGTSSGGVALSVAAGDAVSVDAQANVSLPQALSVTKLATLAGGVSSPQANLGQLGVTGNSTLGGNVGIGGSAQITGDLTAHKITATSDLSAASLSTQGHIAGGSLTITGQTILAGLDVQGTFHAAQIQSDGVFYFPASDPGSPGLALADEHGTGLFAAQGTIGLSVAGQSALSFGGDLKANFAGTVAGASAIFTDVATATLEVSGKSTLHALLASTLALSDAATFANNLDVQGNLQVEGTTRLANLAIDMLSTDHNLSVGGNAYVAGTTSLGGDTSIQGSVTATGAGSFASLSTGRFNADVFYFNKFRQNGTDKNQPYVDNDVTPGNTIIPYTALLAAGGVLKIAGAFTSLAGGTFAGNVSMAGLTAAGGSFSGNLAASGTGSFGDALSAASLAVSGAITALTSTVGGSMFQTCHGTPNGQVQGSVGDWVIDADAGQAYLKQSGSQTATGWVEITTQANATGFPLLAPDTAASAVPFSFASDGGTGMGRNSGMPLYLALGGAPVLTFAGGGAATFAQALTAAGALTAKAALVAQTTLQVTGFSSLAGLSAGTTQVGALTAGNTTVGTLSAQATQVTTLTAGATTVAQLTVQGPGTFQAALSAVGAISSQASLQAPLLQVGSANITSGSGNPNGAVSGGTGDLFIEQDTAALWQKTDGSANSGWLQAGGGAGSFPLAAPLQANFAAPSYGFRSSQMGITDNGANVLVGVTNGTVGWTLDASQNFSLAANFSAAGKGSLGGTFSVVGASTLAALSAAAITGSGSLSIAGATTLQAVTAAAVQATSLTTTTGSVTSALNVSAAGTLSGLLVISNGSTWRAASAAPSSSVGSPGDLASIQGTSDHPLQLRVGSAWRQVALVGDPTPSQFPLNGPADSAGAPNYSTQLSPNTGMYFPAANQIAWSTNGVRAGMVDASGNWTFVGSVSAGAATFSGLTVNGNSSVTGNESVGGTFQATGQATFASGITAQSAAISQGITAAQATINGPLGVQTITTSGDVTVGGNLTVQGTTTYTGVQRSGYYQTGDGTISSPSYAYTNEPGLGMWRKGSGNLAFAAAGSNLLSLSASLATFSGAGSFPGGVSASVVDTPVVRNSGGTLALQAGTTTVLSVGSSSIGAAQPLYVPGGSTSAPGLVIGVGGGLSNVNDTRTAFPVSVSLTNPRGYGITLTSVPDTNTNSTYTIFNAGTGGMTAGAYAPNGYANGSPGYIYCNGQGGSGNALWVYESTSGGTGGWVAVRTASQPVNPSFPIVGPAGSASAPTYAVGGASTGLFSGTDANSRAFLGLTQAGSAVARLLTFSANSLPVYVLGLGDPTSTSTSGGVAASAQAPSTGAPAALPGMLYQDTRGGAAQSLWVNESTTSTPSFVKVLTTSTAVQASFPLLASPDGSLTAPSYSWASETGLGWFRSAAATMTATAAGAALATLTTNLLTLPGALRVGGTNAGLTSPGANQLALQTSGATALSFASTGIGTFAFQAIHAAGTAAAPGVAVGGSSGGLYSGSDAYSQAIVGISTAGLPVANFVNATQASIVTYQLRLGDPASTTARGGIIASAQTPNGNVSGTGGQIFQYLNGGAAQSLWVFEGTSAGTSNWAKVLTTSSTITPSFPQSAPNGTAAAPSYGFGGTGAVGAAYGVYAGTDAFSAKYVGIAAAGLPVARFSYNGSPAATYILGLGDPSSTTAGGGLQASTVLPSGNIGAFPSTLYQYLPGGAGKSLWVYEGTSSGNSAWVAVYTPGTSQIAGAFGTAAAPYHSFSGAAINSGVFFTTTANQAGANSVGVSYAGLSVANFYNGAAGGTGQKYYAINLGDSTQSSVLGGLCAAAATPIGNITGTGGQLYQWLNGGAGASLWVYEGVASGTSAWSKVITTGSLQPFLSLAQSSAPASSASVTKLFADTAAGRVNFVTTASAASGVQPYLQPEIAATVFSSSQTLSAAQNGATIVASGATQYSITLPATAAYDQIFRIQIEGSGGFKLIAPAGVTIYLGGNASSVAGNVTSTTVGSFLTLTNRAGSSLYVAREITGTWTTA